MCWTCRVILTKLSLKRESQFFPFLSGYVRRSVVGEAGRHCAEMGTSGGLSLHSPRLENLVATWTPRGTLWSLGRHFLPLCFAYHCMGLPHLCGEDWSRAEGVVNG